MRFHFYDIETLDNAFTCAVYIPEANQVDIYMLIDEPLLEATPKEAIVERIYEANKNFRGNVELFYLRKEAQASRFATEIGLSDAGAEYISSTYINDPDARDSFDHKFRLTCDTDPNYDVETHPFLCGYNSYAYDTTMIAQYFSETWPIQVDKEGNITKSFEPPTAKSLRIFNDWLFSPALKGNMPQGLLVPALSPNVDSNRNWKSRQNVIRKNMLMSGRHIDVARINEKQRKVALKRLCGLLGFQILESEKLSNNTCHIDTQDELCDLIAYNVSDVVQLKLLFEDPAYQGPFSLKQGLLQSYPDMVYCRKRDKEKLLYEPDISPKTVRSDRLFIDSTSAQFATKALCPYDNLYDIPAVSYLYPSESQAKKMDIKQRNILEECKEFFYENIQDTNARAAFDNIYDYYKSVEGKNFNSCEKTYIHGLPVSDIDNDVPKVPNTIPYFLTDGSPSSCFISFSTGGIHGAEYNQELFDAEFDTWEHQMEMLAEVKQLFPEPTDCRKAKKFPLSDGQEHIYTEFLKSGATLKKAAYKDIASKKPILFPNVKSKNANSAKATKLNNKYKYTSADFATHEDFTSYYPNLLIMMSAFENPGLGYDRYNEIFQDKQRFGKLMKDKSLSEEERALYKVKREGTKLILNAASGAADATFDSAICMNNRIISMRIIGQLFSWRIGQAQTLAGAKIPSTNTDGLYAVAEDYDTNVAVLEREAATIGVEIEPEKMYLISKDTNNRLELDAETKKILSASGASLSCWEKPTPTQALSHPAIIDWALAKYLIATLGPDVDAKRNNGAPFDRTLGRSILESSAKEFDAPHLLQMFQNVIASSPGTFTFNFARDVATKQARPIQHYNRIFMVKEGIRPDAVTLHAACLRVITASTKEKRKREGLRPNVAPDAELRSIFAANGIFNPENDKTRDSIVKKLTGIEETWSCVIENHSLFYLTEDEQRNLVSALDIEKYLTVLEASYEENWRNKLPDTLD